MRVLYLAVNEKVSSVGGNVSARGKDGHRRRGAVHWNATAGSVCAWHLSSSTDESALSTRTLQWNVAVQVADVEGLRVQCPIALQNGKEGVRRLGSETLRTEDLRTSSADELVADRTLLAPTRTVIGADERVDLQLEYS